MTHADTVVLVTRAREGNHEAWSQLVERYYERWIGKYHADLGSTIRKMYDTQDLVQSAVGDAMRDLPKLENEAAFFTWVTSIIRHKVAVKRRRLGRETPADSRAPAEDRDGAAEPSAEDLDDYINTLDKILELFPEHPGPMAAVTMMFIDKIGVDAMIERFGKSKASVYRWAEAGVQLLKGHLKQ